jgi:membrane protease YdiL (CAAX protease family)
MVWLAWLYVVVILGTIISVWTGKEILPTGAENVHEGPYAAVTAMLVYWMSSPVANQILFFGFGQTILMKQWGDGLKVGRFPVVVLFSALLFTYGATSSQFAFGEYSALFTFILGLFCGMVYWKTNSLITPMLGHAFYLWIPILCPYHPDHVPMMRIHSSHHLLFSSMLYAQKGNEIPPCEGRSHRHHQAGIPEPV